MDSLTKCANPDCDEQFLKSVHNKIYHSPQCKRTIENVVRRREMTADVVAAIAPTYGLEIDDKVDYLRKEVQRLGRENEKLKHQREEQVAAIHNAIHDGLSQLDVGPIPAPLRDPRPGQEEVAVVALSDLQLAKVTPTYNTEICEARVELYGDRIIHYTDMHRTAGPIRKVHVWLLGDIIEGQGIFPGQQFLVDAGFYRQVTISGPRIVGNLLLRLLANFDEVVVTGVIGNHGRMGGMARTEFDPESNGDRMLYRILQLMFVNEERIKFVIPDGPGERNWYAIDPIGNYRTLLCHGDQFPSFGSMFSIGRKVLAWKAGAIQEPWDDIMIGHFHQATKMTFGYTTLRVGGTTESTNTYAQERLASMGQPSQHLMYVDPEKGHVTAEYDVVLS